MRSGLINDSVTSGRTDGKVSESVIGSDVFGIDKVIDRIKHFIGDFTSDLTIDIDKKLNNNKC